MKFIFRGSIGNLPGGNATMVFGSGRGWPKPKLTGSLAVLILANLVPIIGVTFFGWTLFEILYLYVLEGAVIGIYNVPKLAMVRAPARDRMQNIFVFLVMYGMFVGTEFLALAGLFGGPGETMLVDGRITDEAFKVFAEHADVVTVALATLFVSHGFSFFKNFLGKKEYLGATLEQLKGAPFLRVFVMHFTVGLGSFLSFKLGSPIPALIILGLLKMAFDTDAHAREHARAAARRAAMPSPAEMQKLLETSKVEIERKYPKGGLFPRFLMLCVRAMGKRLDLYRKPPDNVPGASTSASQEKEDGMPHP